MVADQKHVRIRPDLYRPGVWHGVFMARVVPHITLTGMDFLVLELDPAAPIKEIAQTSDLFGPYPLDLFAPTGF